MGVKNYIVILFSIVLSSVNALSNLNNGYTVDPRSAFDQDLYEKVLDPVECQRQLEFLERNPLQWHFLDASSKLPSGMLTGNWNDLGDYYQCLSIDQIINDMEIKGKYCTVTIPIDQDIFQMPDIPQLPEIPDFEWPDVEWPFPTADNSSSVIAKKYRMIEYYARHMAGLGDPIDMRIFPMLIAARMRMTLAVCVPQVCTATQAIDFLLSKVPFIDVEYTEYYCRLPNDKPFTAADYTAMAIFGFLGLLLIMSTSYDLCCRFYLKRDPSRINSLHTCFSVYTNTRRFLTFNSSPGTLECLDGIRALSMMWVVVGHTYCMTLLGFIHNLSDTINWMTSFNSVWVNSAPIVVDTFFMLSGILAVYTTLGKISKPRFIRSIHMFILNRLLRMFPLLAAVVLLQASLFNHVSDGPYWLNVAHATENCQKYWWSALLYVQNYVNTLEVCLSHSWYLSVDTQLYLTVPIVLLFLFGRKSIAWIAMTIALLASLISTSIISFMNNYSAALANPGRLVEFNDYVKGYYMNTLARGGPFYVGIIYGYILVQCRDKKVRISKLNACILWLMSLAMMAFCIFTMYPVMQIDHTRQTFDNFLNSYMRSIWAGALGWLIFACVHGYGGPINWFLSLQMWKLPARMSYAMYLLHFPIIVIANGSWVKTHYFSDGDSLYRFMGDLSFAFIAAFVLCITIDAPFSTLQKVLINGGGKRRTPPPEKLTKPEYPGVTIEDDRFVKTVL